MHSTAILFPTIALAFWTQLVLWLIPVVRVAAVRRRELGPDDFRYGESARVPDAVSLPNRHYMNLLELPLLFYVVSLLLYATAYDGVSGVVLAWAYALLRVLHSLVHLSYNKVLHRMALFAVSTIVLLILWILATLHVATLP